MSGKWVAGQSGNPSGRPKESVDLREKLRKLSPKAIEILAAVLDATNIGLRDKIDVAKFVVSRTIPIETRAEDAQTDQDAQLNRLAAVLVRPAKDKEPDPEGLADFQAVAAASEAGD